MKAKSLAKTVLGGNILVREHEACPYYQADIIKPHHDSVWNLEGASSETCTACAVGQYAHKKGLPSCVNCAHGKYQGATEVS